MDDGNEASADKVESPIKDEKSKVLYTPVPYPEPIVINQLEIILTTIVILHCNRPRHVSSRSTLHTYHFPLDPPSLTTDHHQPQPELSPLYNLPISARELETIHTLTF